MSIQRASKAGFCFGVKRAIEMAQKAVENGKTVTLGPLIHNQQVVDELAGKGIEQVNAIDDVEEGCQIVIRSHGVPPEVYTEAKARFLTVIDATCPNVQKAQRLAAQESKHSLVAVVGDRSHPEIIGLLGWAGENATVIETLEEARNLPYYPRITVLAQTTQSGSAFSLIADELRMHADNLTVHNTICNATQERQASAGNLSREVDIMIVAGGRSSSNTRKLAAICSENTVTYLIETASELQENWFYNAKKVGLTAGASTPDWIIEEVYEKMAEILANTNDVVNEKKIIAENGKDNMDQVEDQVEDQAGDNPMADYNDELPQIYRGAIVNGTIVKITYDEVIVDIGWKSEGIIPLEELSAAKVTDANEVVKLGDQISAMVTKVENKEGYTILSRKRVAEIEAKERLAEAAASKEEIQAKVTEVVKGGLLVDLGMRGFVPASQIDLGFVEDLNQYLGKTLRLRVLEFDGAKKKLVLSQKVILEQEKRSERENLLQSIQEGDIVRGIVRRLANFGAFIDIGGADGLLHVSDMAFSRVNNPSDIVNIGDEVMVQILRVDREKARISLGLKQIKANPWTGIEEKYPVGSIIEGTVVRIAPFGAFIQIEDGVDGLVHISQLAEQRVNKVHDIVRIGERISAKVIGIKPEEKRISLSIKEAASLQNEESYEAEKNIDTDRSVETDQKIETDDETAAE